MALKPSPWDKAIKWFAILGFIGLIAVEAGIVMYNRSQIEEPKPTVPSPAADTPISTQATQ